MRAQPDQRKTFTHLATAFVIAAVVAAAPLTIFAQAQSGPGPGPFESSGPGCNVFPPSAALGTGVDPSYFGPPPSETNQSLVGPVQLLRSGPVNFEDGTITLPLYKGALKRGGKTVWYILTDTNDPQAALSLGLNFSQKLSFSAIGARTGNINADGTITFDSGTVNFSPERTIVPGPAAAPFPPASAQPGSVGDRDYSPLVRLLNAGGAIYNAPIIAFGVDESAINFPAGNPDYRIVHDQVKKIDPQAGTVTLNLVSGFSFGRPLLYVSMDASIPLAAAIEGGTYAPRMANLPIGGDDSFASPVERLFIAVNGPSQDGCDNPQRQGLFAALTDGFRPNNVFGGIPTIALDYSPMWDANLYEWTQEAINAGYRSQLREEFQILGIVERGFAKGLQGVEFGSSGFIVNCPVVFRLL